MKYKYETMIERFGAQYPDEDLEQLLERLRTELKQIKAKYNNWTDLAPVDKPEVVMGLFSIAEAYRLFHDIDLKLLYEPTVA